MRVIAQLALQMPVEELHRNGVGFAGLGYVGIVEEAVKESVPQVQLGVDA